MKAIMNLQAKKLELVQMILNTEKPAVLAKVEAVFKKEKGADWWDELGEDLKAELAAISAGIVDGSISVAP